jgi:hypothetical protein
MVNSEFERIMLEQTFEIKKSLAETCERLTKVETKIDDAVINKKQQDDAKHKRLMTFIAAVGSLSGVSTIWNLIHTAK